MRRPTLVSLFTGAGGLDLGLESAGFRTAAALDNDARCVESLRRNQALRIQRDGGGTFLEGARILGASVADVTAGDLRPPRAPDTWRLDLLAGGPPCQPFSSAGKQLSLEDPRGRLFEHFVRLARSLRPRFILFENVRGIVTARGPSGEPGEVINLIRDSFESIGYATTFALHNSADYGLPQRRVRCFMLATSGPVLPEFPRPTHGERPIPSLGRSSWTTLGDFLRHRGEPPPAEVVRPSSRLSAVLTGVRAGSGLKSPGAREATRPGGHWGYKQGTFIADPGLPARTVTAASTQDWIRAEDGSLRRLTVSECAALQGFPADWQFVGSSADRFRQVGNAVPTVFGLVLGKALIDALQKRATGRRRAVSAPFPPEFLSAIAYTRRDSARNGSARAIVRAARGATASRLKGLGSAERDSALPLFDGQVA